MEAAAIGIPDELKGEVLWVFAVVLPGVTADDALRSEISRRVVDALGPSFKPAQVRFTNALPKTRSAKVLRRAIRAVVTGHAPGDVRNKPSAEELREYPQKLAAFREFKTGYPWRPFVTVKR